jgi:hypothetical protein
MAAPALGQAGQNAQIPIMISADEQGAFRFETNGVKEFSVRAHLAPFATTSQLRVGSGQRITLKLETGVTVTGEVTAAANGEPLPGAVVEASEWDLSPYGETDPDFAMTRAKTDSKGRFTLNGVPGGGRQMVRVQARGFASETAVVSTTAPMKFRLAPGHDLSGVVLDAAGRPVQKAAITMSPAARSGSSALSARTNAAGRFEVLGLKNVPYNALVIAEGFAPFVKSNVPPDLSSLTISLDKASSVTGRLVDEEGKPLKGAVRLVSHDGAAAGGQFGMLGAVPASAEGRFTLKALRPGSNVIQLAGFGYPAIEKTIEIAQAGESVSLGDVAFEAGWIIRARVVEKGDVPIAAARVVARLSKPGEVVEPLFVEADADGRFVMRGLQEQPYQLGISASGFATLDKSVSPSADEQVLVMNRAVKLSARIVDPDGQPVGRAQVTVQKGDDRRTYRIGTSAGDGRVSIDLAEGGSWKLAASAEGFEVLAQSVSVEGDTDAGDITLSRGVRLRGAVVDSKGSAVAFARVENQTTRQTVMTFAETDEKGAFEIRGVSPGRVRLVASHPDYSPAQVTVDAPESSRTESEPVRITLTKGARIEGSVKQRDGTPMAQTMIQVFSPGNTIPQPTRSGPERTTLTRPDGTFTLERLYPGAASVVVLAGQNERFVSVSTADVTLVDGETAPVSFVIRSTIVRGVLRRSGGPVAGLRVSVFGSSYSMMSGSGNSSSMAGEIPWSFTNSDAEGRFALRVVGPLTGRAIVTSSDQSQTLLSKSVNIPDVDEFPLDLEFGAARARGRVVDQATGLGIADARVNVRPMPKPGETVSSNAPNVRTDARGAFVFDLEPGTFQMSVTADGFVGANSKVEISPPETGLEDIALDRGATHSGRVLAASGRPVPEAQIRTMAGGWFQNATSGLDGTFTLRGLGAAPFTLAVSDGAENFGILRIDTIPSEAVEVRLEPAARINVRVMGAPGDASGLSVSMGTLNGAPYPGGVFARANAQGLATLMAPPGELVLSAGSVTHFGRLTVLAHSGEVLNVVIEVKPRPRTPIRE